MGAFTITIPTSDGTCSTPFGITDYIGRALQAESLRALVVAQRLSASLIISAVDMPQQRRRPSLMVLNAFRHHGLYRPNQNWSSIDITGAQRLSASRIISAAVAAPVLPRRLMCSTPFGITDYIGTLHPAVTTENDAMCSTPFGITDYIGRARGDHAGHWLVLNAFRHHGLYRSSIDPRRPRLPHRRAQRLSASRIISEIDDKANISGNAMCSTPFGITDYIGSRHRPGCGYCLVLNAFRHHGLYRIWPDAVVEETDYRCSTPFGITDYIGRHRRV